MSQALKATSEKEAWGFWKKAQWDGETGLSTLGDAPWAWLINLDHLYLVKTGLDIGKQKSIRMGMAGRSRITLRNGNGNLKA